VLERKVAFNGPIVSVVIPSHNHGKFIKDAVRSVLDQDYPKIELIIIDDGSADSTDTVLAEFAEQLTLVKEPDRNRVEAINKGIRLHAIGEIITWLSADNELLPNAVSTVVDALSIRPTASAALGPTQIIDDHGAVLSSALVKKSDLLSTLHVAAERPQSPLFLRKSAFEAIGGFDESLCLLFQWDATVKLASNCEVVQIEEPITSTRIHGESLRATCGTDRLSESISIVLRYGTGLGAPVFVSAMSDLLIQVAQRNLRARRHLNVVALQWLNRVALQVRRQLVDWSRGVWGDGWVSSCGRFLLTSASADTLLEIVGTVPGSDQVYRDQVLEIEVDGERIDRVVLPPGEFRLVYERPKVRRLSRATRPHNGLTDVRIRSGWAACPAEWDPEIHDERKLSWHSSSVQLEAPGEVKLPDPVGWFDDGWVAPVLTIFVPGSAIRLRLVGSIPPPYAHLVHDQLLRVEIDGRLISKLPLSEGHFEVEVDLRHRTQKEVSTVRISAAKWFVPRLEQIENDPRRLTFRLEDVLFSLPGAMPDHVTEDREGPRCFRSI